MQRPTIALLGAEHLDEELRSRVLHGFRVLAETLGLVVVQGPADLSVGYGVLGDISLERGLKARNSQTPAPQPEFVTTPFGRSLPMFHPSAAGKIDLVGEVFEWSSGLHELSVETFDAHGRVPAASTLPVHAGLDPKVAWANRLIDEFADMVVAERPSIEAHLARRGETAVAISHDLDYYRRGPMDDVNRIVRGSIAAARRGDWATVQRILAMAAKHRHRVGEMFDTVDDLIALDESYGVEASWVLIPRKAHFRDANYELDDIVGLVDRLRGDVDIAVHGSYSSLLPSSNLEEEYDRMRRLGLTVSGGRQHWLRYNGIELFRVLERCGATWDSSAAYSDRVGFRHGFATPFWLYDPFARRSLEVLQVPLVLMDMAIDGLARAGGDWFKESEAVLAELENVRGAAVSVLWHDTVFNGTQIHPPIVDYYRTLLERRYRWKSLSALADEWCKRGQLFDQRRVA